jgi:hypothetical protein
MAPSVGALDRLDGGLQFGGIDVVGPGIDVHEDRGGAEEADHFGRGDEGKGGGEDRIARANAVSHERHKEGVGARGAADGMLCAHVGGKLLFELFDFRPHDVIAMCQNLLDICIQLFFDS